MNKFRPQRKILIILVIFILVAGVVGGAMYTFRNRGNIWVVSTITPVPVYKIPTVTLLLSTSPIISPPPIPAQQDIQKMISRRVTELIRSMSVEEKAGQMLMFQANGQTMTPEYATKLKTLHSGGVILMGDNISSPSQVSSFVLQINQQVPSIPMWIATDEEGGVVKRFPWDQTLGESSWASMSNDQICQLAVQRSALLSQAHVNVNFAPVVDLSYQGTAFINSRTISSNPSVVTEKAQSFINCSQNNKVAVTLKHYPGHGATPANSHDELPVVLKTKTEWLAQDAIPFKNLKNEKFIMVGHMLFKNIDPNNPSSISSVFINEILRKEFNYQGLVITDSMSMLHKTTGITVRDALTKAFNSGVDIVLYVSDPKVPIPETAEQIYRDLVTLIRNKVIPEDVVETALRRILTVKMERLGMF